MSEKKALQLHSNDNVAVCTQTVEVGDCVTIMQPDGSRSEIVAATANTYCNKIALCDIACGQEVIKYGEVIGVANQTIALGALANHLNIDSQPRAYADEYLLK